MKGEQGDQMSDGGVQTERRASEAKCERQAKEREVGRWGGHCTSTAGVGDRRGEREGGREGGSEVRVKQREGETALTDSLVSLYEERCGRRRGGGG